MQRILLTLLPFLFYSFNCLSQVNLNNGLVAYYPFTGNANDISGNNQNGVPQNSIRLTSDRFGNLNSAYSFDGVDDYISVNDNAGLFSTPKFSLVIWFKTTSNNLQNLVGKRDFGPTNGTQYQFFINYSPFPGIGSNIISDQNNCSVGITAATSYINSNQDICIGRWYCAVITFDGVNHNIYINGILRRSSPAGFSSMAICKSEMRFGNWWQGDLIPFAGIMDDIRWYNRPITSDEIAFLSEGSGSSTNADFSFNFSLCQPLQVSFNTLALNPGNTIWNFGDQTNSSGISNPNHIYSAPGIYNIQLITRSGLNCFDTIAKPIELMSIPHDIILNRDTGICVGDSVRIRTSLTGEFCWNNNPSVSSAGIDSYYVKPVARTSYTVRTVADYPNLVFNGDFESGNSGFGSNYQFTNLRNGDGQYGISSDASTWYTGLACNNCKDHSNGSTGRMLVADASIQTGNKLWNQIIQVIPNTTYKISFWGIAYDPQVTPRIDIDVNNKYAGSWSITPQEAGTWKKFNLLWNSGTDSLLVIALQNANTSSNLNRFSIDDIEVSRFSMLDDSFVVDVNQSSIITASTDSLICPGQTVHLNVTGGTGYLWTPSTGLSDPTIPNPIASPISTTMYYVNSVAGGTCTGKDSVLVTVKPAPNVLTSNDASTCLGYPVQISASGGIQYHWTPEESLSDPRSPNPMANPAINTVYIVQVQGSNGCTDSASIKVIVTPAGKIFIPNTFTPNADGINDCFGIKGSQGATYFELAIYNRFGERIFYSNNPSICWNGTYKGIPQPVGSYAYYLKMLNSCGKVNEKGTVTIVR